MGFEERKAHGSPHRTPCAIPFSSHLLQPPLSNTWVKWKKETLPSLPTLLWCCGSTSQCAANLIPITATLHSFFSARGIHTPTCMTSDLLSNYAKAIRFTKVDISIAIKPPRCSAVRLSLGLCDCFARVNLWHRALKS